MHKTNLRAVDLNLLVVLEALLAERHVTRAAESLAMSQPAVSRALNRLRELFHDPLLVRGATGLVPTAHARQLEPALSEVLAGIRQLMAPMVFDPAESRQTIRLGCLDLEAAIYLSALVPIIRNDAPGMHLDIYSHPDDFFVRLATGDLDLVISALDPASQADQFHRRVIDRSALECLMGADNPLAAGDMTLERYLSANHGVVSITGKGPAIMDMRLQALGRTRNVVLNLSSFLNVPDACAESDVVFALPQRLAGRLARDQLLVTRPLPDELRGKPMPMYLYWHQRNHQDPMQQWLRARVLEAVEAR